MAKQKENKTEKKQIEAIVGQPVQITLQSHAPSTGYSWFLTKLSGGLALSDVTSVPTAVVPGAPINQIFTFLATGKGTYEVEFSLIAPWRPGQAYDTETYQVIVKEPGKTAAEDIESAMKGREFIRASAVDVGAAAVLKYAAPSAQPMLDYAAPMASCAWRWGPVMVAPYAAPVTRAQPMYAAPMTDYYNCGPVMVAPYAAPWTQAQPVYAAPMDPCLDPRNRVLAANTMIAYAAPVGPSTVAAIDPCLDPRNSVLAASTMIAYAAPVGGPSTMAARAADPMLLEQRYAGPSVAAAHILYAAPIARTQAQASGACILYAAPMARTQAQASGACILYAAPMARTNAGVAAANVLYAAPVDQAHMVCATQMMPPYAAPYTAYGCY